MLDEPVAPDPPLEEGRGGSASGATLRGCSDALLANWRAWSALTRRPSAWVTAAGLGCAFAMSSAPRPRIPTVEVAVVVLPLLLPNRLPKPRIPLVAVFPLVGAAPDWGPRSNM